MIKNIILCLFVMTIVGSIILVATMPIQSDWHKHQIDLSLDKRERQAYALGVGDYLGNEVEWFAYMNSDGYFQLNLSVELEPEDRKILEKTYDRNDRTWRYSSNDPMHSGATAWIGLSNDWFKTPCGEQRRTDFEGSKICIVNQYTDAMQETLAGNFAFGTIKYL